MRDALRPILELSVVIPGLLLAYFPVRSYLKQTPGRLAAWLLPLLLALCVGGGLLCCLLRVSTALASAFLTPLAVFLYIRMLRISLWKSGTIALSVCAVLTACPELSAPPWYCGCSCRWTSRGSALAPAFSITRSAGWPWPRHIILRPTRCAQWSRTTILRGRGMCSGFCRWCSSC